MENLEPYVPAAEGPGVTAADSAWPVVRRRRRVKTTVRRCLVLSTHGVVTGLGRRARAVYWTRVDRRHRAADVWSYGARRCTSSLQHTRNMKNYINADAP